MYTRRKKEIDCVSGAYFTDIIIHCGFGERDQEFLMLFGETFAFISRGLNRGSLNIEHFCCVAVDTLLSFLKC